MLHAIADHIVDGYLAVTETIEDEIDDLEREVFTPRSAPNSERIYAMKREALEYAGGGPAGWPLSAS